jgi:hypothetical protein
VYSFACSYSLPAMRPIKLATCNPALSSLLPHSSILCSVQLYENEKLQDFALLRLGGWLQY